MQVSIVLNGLTLMAQIIILVDEVNAPVVIDSSMNFVDVSASSVAGSKFVAHLKTICFMQVKYYTRRIIFSVPFDEDDFTVAVVQEVYE